MVHQVTELIHVRVATDTITCTPIHPLWVAGRGWVAAGELTARDTLQLADIVSVTRERLASPVDVYHIEVADYRTYFVASAGIWVHNCGSEGSIFNGDGTLTDAARSNSVRIIPGDKLVNQKVVDTLTSDASSISDWGKYATKDLVTAPSGTWQTHFYMNSSTGAVNYCIDYKMLLSGR